jgi:hypothetical protein
MEKVHWEKIYAPKEMQAVSWFRNTPKTLLDFLKQFKEGFNVVDSFKENYNITFKTTKKFTFSVLIKNKIRQKTNLEYENR